MKLGLLSAAVAATIVINACSSTSPLRDPDSADGKAYKLIEGSCYTLVSTENCRGIDPSKPPVDFLYRDNLCFKKSRDARQCVRTQLDKNAIPTQQPR